MNDNGVEVLMNLQIANLSFANRRVLPLLLVAGVAAVFLSDGFTRLPFVSGGSPPSSGSRTKNAQVTKSYQTPAQQVGQQAHLRSTQMTVTPVEQPPLKGDEPELMCAEIDRNCAALKCCANAGLQCYQKNSSWATCMESCEEGVILTSPHPGPWSCHKLGARTKSGPPKAGSQCANEWEDCAEKGCCREPGTRCYSKDDYWAQCKVGCQPGWACEPLGPRTPLPAPRTLPFAAVSPRVATRCASSGADCSESRCCSSAGQRCYEKNATWAACRSNCTPGMDLSDIDWRPWTCEVLGPRTPMSALLSVEPSCANSTANCVKSRCCLTPGQQCYLQEEGVGRCNYTCDTESGSWCMKLGNRTPLDTQLPEADEQTGLSKWVANRCAADGDNCIDSHCCQSPGLQCYSNNSWWAACNETCDKNDTWTCTELGPRTPASTMTQTTSTSTITHTTTGFTTFCVSIVRVEGYEAELMKAQHKLGTGIFACDDFGVLSTQPVQLAPGVNAILFQDATVGWTSAGTVANAKLFVNAWNSIKDDGRWEQHDWTLKADPDALLIPSRLHRHLGPLNGQSVFVVTCNDHMYGALEAFSRKAMMTYYKHEKWSCREWQDNAWGEDLYMEKCMTHINVTRSINHRLVSDGRCYGVNCGDLHAAAFHPFKSMSEWKECMIQAQASSSGGLEHITAESVSSL